MKMVTDARMEIVGSQSYSDAFLSQQPGLDQIRVETKKALEQLEVLQRQYAAPVTVHYEVKRSADRGVLQTQIRHRDIKLQPEDQIIVPE
ncbi:MAG: hypothetical protein ACKVY0_27915 [Prosthecobacter sp.]|uniref:hypothetical protein n=1 Tax=Prosthecobacter sp. TaxID=1965333 RepID=UPI00390237A0